MNGTTRSGPRSPGEPAWNASHMLDVHILDYLKKRNLHETAASFKHECKLSDKPCVIEAPSGFLFEWWSIFWDIYISRINPSFSESASTYSEAQKAKIPIRQQQLQQQVQQQQHQMLQQQLMREKDLSADDAAQYAQQIMTGRIRLSELSAVGSTANQEHMVANLRQKNHGLLPFQAQGATQMDETARGSASSLPSPGPEARASTLDAQQRQQLLAAFQASKRSANQANLGPGQAFEQLRGANPQTPLASPSSGHPNSHPEFPQALMQRQTCQPGAASAMLSQPSTVPPELRQQAIQKLQLQYLQQQQQQVGEQGALQRGMSVDLSAQPGSSRQSSGTVRRYSQSPTMPAQQLQQPALTPQQMMLLHHIQQHTGESSGGQLHVPESEVQRRLLAQISSRGLLKPEHRFETAGLGNPLSCHTATTSHVLQNHGDATLRTQQQQRQQQQLQQQQMVAELQHAHHHHHHHQQQQQQQQQHQARAGGQLGVIFNSHAKMDPGLGQQATPNITDVERQMPSCDSGQNRDSPANSTAAGSTLQTGRATPVPTNSGARNSSRAHGPKAANGPSNKKRKHSASTSPSNSESQETPSSNASGCSGSHKASVKQVPSSSALQHSMDQVSWGHAPLSSASILNSTGIGMNAAAAALDSSSNILNDLMGDDGLLDTNLDPLLSLDGEGDPADASFLSG